ncbi:hypothetical protein PR048_005439 [Dryococelus australis]|uniref:Hexosyltransferase n=1 Tax=Dryococelus australis TaxID=614101 RepID=A0ABQ9I877_9NEOP|nr:hypothetical protein PR048_005439 [Dryococelus australis]
MRRVVGHLPPDEAGITSETSQLHNRESIENENKEYGDIFQADFEDTYFNNTIKTMIGINWVMNFCLNSKFYMFVDDDFYVSTKNVLRFLRNPTEYPQYLELPAIALQQYRKSQMTNYKNGKTGMHFKEPSLKINRRISQLDFELPDDVKLFSGFVFVSAPHRHRSSKWFVTLSEYPFHMWPPYVTAGAYVLSHDALPLRPHLRSFYPLSRCGPTWDCSSHQATVVPLGIALAIGSLWPHLALLYPLSHCGPTWDRSSH